MTRATPGSTRVGLAVRHDLDHSITVTRDGDHLLTYVYAPGDPQLEAPRPYFHPLHTAGGDLMSVYRPHDHVWHKGLAVSLPNVGPYNFWGGPTYRRGQGYAQLDNVGSMDHDRFTTLTATDGQVRVAHDLVWRGPPGNGTHPGGAVVRERRGFTVTCPAPDVWVLVHASALTNVSGSPLDIGSPTTEGRENAGYGGLFWRGPRSFTGGTILAPGREGGDTLRGVRAEWMGFAGRHDGKGRSSTLVMVDDPGNPVHPPRWFVRSEIFACVNPAPFFSEEVPFPPDGSLTFRHAVVVADGGADPDRGEQLAGYGRAALAGYPGTS